MLWVVGKWQNTPKGRDDLRLRIAEDTERGGAGRTEASLLAPGAGARGPPEKAGAAARGASLKAPPPTARCEEPGKNLSWNDVNNGKTSFTQIFRYRGIALGQRFDLF